MLATECSLPLYSKVSQSFQLHFFSIFPFFVFVMLHIGLIAIDIIKMMEH